MNFTFVRRIKEIFIIFVQEILNFKNLNLLKARARNSKGLTKSLKVDKNVSNTIITTTTTINEHVFIETEFLTKSSFEVNIND